MYKNLLKSIAFAALAIVAGACAKEQVAQEGQTGMVTFEVENPVAATKAIGDGTTAKQLYYQVFDAAGKPIAGLPVQSKELTSLKTTVSFQLIKDQKYNFVFWAQTPTSGYYTIDGTEGLKKITANYEGKKSNDENFDAFYAVEKNLTINGPVTKTISLKRPFAQINVATTDVLKAGETTSKVNFDGAMAAVTVKDVPTVFSPLTDGFSESADVAFASAAIPEGDFTITGSTETYKYMAVNYVFAPEEGTVYDVEASLKVEGKDVALKVPSAPVKRNFRTNIYGNLLTSSADFDVTVVPGFGGEDNISPIFVNGVAYKTLDKAVAAAKTGEQTIIALNQDMVGDGVKATNGQDVIIDLGGHTFDIDGTLVGSAGTETNGFQLLKGSKVTFKNGVLKSKKAKLLIQNYSDLTLENVTLDATGGVADYVLSNNHGTVKILGSSSIMAPEGKYAFDVYYWPPAYSDGVNVYVNTTGTIRGAIQYAGVKPIDEDACYKNTSLIIDNAVLENSKFETELLTPNMKVSRSVFTDEAAATAWIPDGYKLMTDGEYYKVLENSVSVVAEQGDLNTAIAIANSTVVLAAGTYKLPEGSKSIAEGVTIIGNGEGTVLNTKASEEGGDYKYNAQNLNNVTFKSLTINEGNGNYNGIKHSDNLKYENCVIVGQPFSFADHVVYEGCTFNQTSSGAYNIWTYGSKEITFNNCVFNCAGKGVLIYNEGALPAGVVTFDKCKFIASESVAGKAAIEIDSRFTSYEVYINDCTHEGFANGSVSGNSLWNKKVGDKPVKIFVDGTQVL